MKRFLYPTLLLVTLSLSSCKKLLSFDMDFNDNVTIPANSLINIPLDILSPVNTTNTEQTLSNKGSASNLISKVQLTGLELNIVNPSNANFNFLKSVEVYLSAPDLAEIKIASNDDVPASDLQNVPLNCVDTDLKDYIKKSTYTIRVKAVTDENLTQNTEVNVHSKLTVDAGIF